MKYATFGSVKLEYLADGAIDTPLIRLYEFTPSEIMRLLEIVTSLAEGAVQSVHLHNGPNIEPIGGCELIFQSGTRDIGIRQSTPPKFECILTPETWEVMGELIASFNHLNSGNYQWLFEKRGTVSLLLSGSGKW